MRTPDRGAISMRTRKYCLLISLLLFFFLMISSVSAQTGSISITPKSTEEGHPVVHGMSFTLYKVADLADDRFAWTSDFAACTEDPNDLSQTKALARTLENLTESGTISGTFVTADADGKIYFPDLSEGLYLIVDDTAPKPYVKVDPFLVSVPFAGADGEWIYEVDATPKMELVDPPADTSPPGIDIDITGGGDQAHTGLEDRLIPLLMIFGLALYAGGVLMDHLGKSHA